MFQLSDKKKFDLVIIIDNISIKSFVFHSNLIIRVCGIDRQPLQFQNLCHERLCGREDPDAELKAKVDLLTKDKARTKSAAEPDINKRQTVTKITRQDYEIMKQD